MSERKFMRLRMLAVFSIATLALAVSAPAFAKGGPPQTPPGQGGTPPGQGGGETTLGNNLSVPVVFAEGYGITGLPVSEDTGLRPRPDEPCYTQTLPCLIGPTVEKDGASYYPQQTESSWQAQWLNGSGTTQDVTVNWSDNLTKQYWTPRSKIRVETVLYENPDEALYPNDYLTGYNMTLLSGTKTTESWGTDGNTYNSYYRTVFSPNAHIIIQKISGPGGTAVGAPCVNETIYGSFGAEGGAGYTAEVNVSGNLIYGYNWTIANCSSDQLNLLGWWRLTFKIDPVANYTVTAEDGTTTNYSVNANTQLSAIDPADLTEVLFTPTLDTANNETSLEIDIRENRQGGGKKGGGENQ